MLSTPPANACDQTIPQTDLFANWAASPAGSAPRDRGIVPDQQDRQGTVNGAKRFARETIRTAHRRNTVMQRPSMVFIVGLAAGAVALTAVAAERPNVVLIVADNLGHGDLSCYGYRTVGLGKGTWATKNTSCRRLKFISFQDGGQLNEWLFDVARDPREESDLIDARPDDASRLKRLLTTWEREVQPTRESPGR
jgi:hypothetical protein